MQRTGTEILYQRKRSAKFRYTEFRKQLKFDKDGRCLNAFTIAASPDTLKLGYDLIKSNPGNMVRGSDQQTLDGISRSWFAESSKMLREEKYRFKPARRVYIPKPNGKKRPLGISSPRDKVIQQSLKLVLEEILEPKFSEYSHGFRPSRGCHSALAHIRKWKGASWVLEGDIKSFFDNIDHDIVANLLKRHFKEQRLINVY